MTTTPSPIRNMILDATAKLFDKFTQKWTTLVAFALPPWCLILTELMKIQIEEATLLLFGSSDHSF